MNRLLTFFPSTGGAVGPLVPVIRVFLIRVDETTETMSSKDEVIPTVLPHVQPFPLDAIFGFGLSDVVVGHICRQIPHLEFAIVSQHG